MGDYRHCTIANHNTKYISEHNIFHFDTFSFDPPYQNDNILRCIEHSQNTSPTLDSEENTLDKNKQIKESKTTYNYEYLRLFFRWSPTDIIKKPYKITTQYACTPMSVITKNHYKFPDPAMNVKRHSERGN